MAPAFAAPLSVSTLLGYGLPGLPLAMLGIPLYVYLPSFYGETLGLGLGAVGMALMLARLWDMVSDPLVGLLADRLPLRRRRRVLMLLGAPVLLLSMHMLLQPPMGAGLVYLYTFGFLAYLGWTLVMVPYTAWGAEIVEDAHGRTRLAASREGFGLLGIVLAASLPVLLDTDTPAAVLAGVDQLLWVLLPIALGLALWRAPEVPAPRVTQVTRAAQGAWPGLPRRQTELQHLLAAYFINGLANGLPAALFILFVTHRLQAPEAVGPLLLVYFAAGVLALPGWILLARRYGRARVWAVSLLWASLAFLAVPFLHAGDVLAFGLICLLSGLALGADLALPASLQAEIARRVSLDEGAHRSGLLFGLLGLVAKLALALAVGLGFGALELGGFDGAAGQGLVLLALLYGLLPVALKLAALPLVLGLDALDRPFPSPSSEIR
ncbi:MAG: MFS transporter [Pseudomonadota bacterium]